jgi:hypothetical protein
VPWYLLTALLILLGFACAFGLCEWTANRMRDRRADRDSPKG